MGSYDGAETCELAGSFLLSQLQELNINIGLYRDDGLVISDTTPRDTENIKKKYAASSITTDYVSPSKPTNRPSIS